VALMLVPLLACLVLWCDAAPANDAATAVQQVEMRANMWWEDMKEMELSELLEKIDEEELDKLETSVLEELSDELWQREWDLIPGAYFVESEFNEEEWNKLNELSGKISDVLREREVEPAAGSAFGEGTPGDRVDPSAQQQDRQPALPPFDKLVMSWMQKMNKEDQEVLMEGLRKMIRSDKDEEKLEKLVRELEKLSKEDLEALMKLPKEELMDKLKKMIDGAADPSDRVFWYGPSCKSPLDC